MLDAPAEDGRNFINVPGIARQLPDWKSLADQRPLPIGVRGAHQLGVVLATLLVRPSPSKADGGSSQKKS